MRIQTTRLEEVCLKITDGSHFSPKAVNEGPWMASSKDMTDCGWDYSELKKISKDDFDKLVKADCKPKANDVLIIKDGNSYLQKVFLVKKEEDIVILSSIAILRPNKDKIDPLYLQYILKTQYIQEAASNFVTGAAIPRVILSDFKKIQIPFPSMAEQQRIASILSAYDDLIEVNNQRIKLLEETARELYKEWFVRMRFPGYKKTRFVKGIPEGWQLVRIDSLYNTSSGGTPSREKKEYYDPGVHSWIKTGELLDGFIFETEEMISDIGLRNSSAKLFPPYTVIFAMYGNTIGQLGITTQRACTNQACCALLPITEEFGFEFIFLTLLHNRETIISFGMGAAQQNVNQEEIRKFKIVKPKTEIVQDFTKLVNPLFKQVETLQILDKELRQIRDRLLPRLISGKLQVEKGKEAKVIAIKQPPVSMVAETEMSYKKKAK